MKKTRSFFVIAALILTVALLWALCVPIFAAGETFVLSIPANSGKVEVRVDGVVKHEGGESCTIYVPKGATVTLKATHKSADFLFWTDENMNTYSESATCSFIMLGPKEMRAWFSASSGTMILYRNNNSTRQVLGSVTCVKPEHFSSHIVTDAVKYGFTFTGWSLTVEQIKTKISSGERLVVVEPNYQLAGHTCSVSVVGGTIDGLGTSSATLRFMSEAVLKADPAPAGQQFLGWKDSRGIWVSSYSMFRVKAWGNETYTAIYAPAGATAVFGATISLEINVEAGTGLRLNSTRYVPDGMMMLSYGIIYGESGASESNMTVENAKSAGLSVAEYTVGAKSGVLTCASRADHITARAFLVVADRSGVTRIVYSPIVSK